MGFFKRDDDDGGAQQAQEQPAPSRSRTCRPEQAPHAGRLRVRLAGRDPRVRPPADRADEAGRRPRLLHQRPVGQRVPARQAGRVRAARAGARQLDLPHRLSAVELEPEPGDGRAHAGDVPRSRAGDDADGGGGRPARRRRRRRRAAEHRPLRVGRRAGRVHRGRHRRQAPRRRASPRARTAGRSPRT